MQIQRRKFFKCVLRASNLKRFKPNPMMDCVHCETSSKVSIACSRASHGSPVRGSPVEDQQEEQGTHGTARPARTLHLQETLEGKLGERNETVFP
jgi:hypothetical protein